MSTFTPPEAGALVRRYPLPAAETDDRFTVGLFLEVAKALQEHGYPPMTGLDLVDLGQALYRLLYTTAPDRPEATKHLAEIAADEVAMARGAALDAAVESTGHMPGYDDNEYDYDAAEHDFYQREQAAELAAEREEIVREMAAEAAYHPTITHDPRTYDDRDC